MPLAAPGFQLLTFKPWGSMSANFPGGHIHSTLVCIYKAPISDVPERLKSALLNASSQQL